MSPLWGWSTAPSRLTQQIFLSYTEHWATGHRSMPEVRSPTKEQIFGNVLFVIMTILTPIQRAPDSTSVLSLIFSLCTGIGSIGSSLVAHDWELLPQLPITDVCHGALEVPRPTKVLSHTWPPFHYPVPEAEAVGLAFRHLGRDEATGSFSQILAWKPTWYGYPGNATGSRSYSPGGLK